MTTLDAPQLNAPGTPSGAGGIADWFNSNKWLLLAIFLAVGVAYVFYLLWHSNLHAKKLQRDALERMRKSLLASCKSTRGPAKSIWLTGSPRDPGMRLGRYKGHYRSVECAWLAYKPGLFQKTRLLCANPLDLTGLNGLEIHVRGIGIHHARDITFATPDTHDATAREDWARVTNTRLTTPREFAEAIKEYYAGCVDNALAFYDSLNAAEDRSFLRQEVTRSQDELTETLTVPAQPTPTNDQPQPE